MARKEEKEMHQFEQSQKSGGRGGNGGSLMSPRGGTMRPWTASPFSFMRRFSEEMDRLFEGFGFGGLQPSKSQDWLTHGGAWSPHIDVFERENQIVVRADLPGMSKEDVKVDVTDDAITIQGERKES